MVRGGPHHIQPIPQWLEEGRITFSPNQGSRSHITYLCNNKQRGLIQKTLHQQRGRSKETSIAKAAVGWKVFSANTKGSSHRKYQEAADHGKRRSALALKRDDR
jgi:hypothetical protein